MMMVEIKHCMKLRVAVCKPHYLLEIIHVQTRQSLVQNIQMHLWKTQKMQNTPLENAVVEFIIAYFLVDSMHYLVFFPDDFVFIAHHLATFFVMESCRYYVGHRGLTAMSLLFLAEITSAYQNAQTLAKITKLESSQVAVIYKILSPLFYSFYTLIRGVVAPILIYHLAQFYIDGKADDVIPRWLACCWIAIVVMAIFGSMAWILNLWIELFRYNAQTWSDKCIKTM